MAGACTFVRFAELQGWPSVGSNVQAAGSGTPNAAMYGVTQSGQQAGYGAGQDLFGQSSGYPSTSAYGAFGQQQAGYGGAQVPFAQTHCALLRSHGAGACRCSCCLVLPCM